MAEVIRVRNEVLKQMADHVLQEPQLECCGLLAGKDGVITRILPAANIAVSPATSYEIASEELFRLMREIRATGLDFMGIYHSHPNGDNKPSARDIDQAYYPDAAHFILSPRKGTPAPVRAFSIRDGKAAELNVQIV
jgi:proteasome lid subunit RPN8/RPN11